MTTSTPFAVWLTGLPASGKSTIARELAARLRKLRAAPVVLGSDEMRAILRSGASSYAQEDRDRFYEQMAQLAALIVRSGVPVIIDATANRSAYRERARSLIPRMYEVHVDTPLEVCRARDPKGLYAAADAGRIRDLPGTQAVYERPVNPDIRLDGRQEPVLNADRIITLLSEQGCI